MEQLTQPAAVPAGLVAPTRAPRERCVHEFGPLEAFGLNAAALVDAARPMVSNEHGYAFVLMTEGEATARHYGHASALARGDFLLVDGAAPLEFAFHPNALSGGEAIVL